MGEQLWLEPPDAPNNLDKPLGRKDPPTDLLMDPNRPLDKRTRILNIIATLGLFATLGYIALDRYLSNLELDNQVADNHIAKLVDQTPTSTAIFKPAINFTETPIPNSLYSPTSTPTSRRIVNPTYVSTATPSPLRKPTRVPSTPTRVPTKIPVLPTPTPQSEVRGYYQDFSTANVVPHELVNATLKYNYSWLKRGNWTMQGNTTTGRNYLRQSIEFPGHYLSFLDYEGPNLAPNSKLPVNYEYIIELNLGPSNYLWPVGDVGEQFEYKDPTHYMELNIKNEEFAIYVCNGGQPGSTVGWEKIISVKMHFSKNQTVTIGAIVNRENHTIQYIIDNTISSPIPISGLVYDPESTFAIRAEGINNFYKIDIIPE